MLGCMPWTPRALLHAWTPHASLHALDTSYLVACSLTLHVTKLNLKINIASKT